MQRSYSVNQSFEIIEKDGFDQILKSVSIYTKTDTQTIGIALDADADLNNKWKSISGILSNIGYSSPKKMALDGMILNEDNLPKLGLWIMPNNNEAGMLEDFINHLVPNEDLLMSVVNDTLESLEARGINKYKSIHRAKARIHTWLAWQESPGTPMGLAITKKYLDTDSTLCQTFIGWVNRLFNQRQNT